jgi:hypothetical protein
MHNPWRRDRVKARKLPTPPGVAPAQRRDCSGSFDLSAAIVAWRTCFPSVVLFPARAAPHPTNGSPGTGEAVQRPPEATVAWIRRTQGSPGQAALNNLTGAAPRASRTTI